MAVNLINSNDTTVSRTDDEITIGFSSARNSQIEDIENSIGDLSYLKTTINNDIVSSINEVYDKMHYIVLEKTTSDSLTQSYKNVTWQVAEGDTDALVLANNDYDVTINCDCKYIVMLLSMNTTSATSLYWKIFKNNNEYSMQWSETVGFHNKIFIMPVENGDVIKSQFYTSTNTNTSTGNMNKMIIIAFN